MKYAVKYAAPVLIAPECHTPGCHHDGDQYAMVKCRGCGHWFCPEHVQAADGQRDVALVHSGLHGLAYYLGRCPTCREQFERRQPNDSAWLC